MSCEGRKPLRPYRCSSCSQVGHRKDKCQAGKAPLLADPAPFSIEEDIREEWLALSWLSLQRYTQ